MLKILFNRKSPMVILVECLGYLFTLLYFRNLRLGVYHKSIPNLLLIILVVVCVLMRLCALWNWYPKADRSHHKENKMGIEIHFIKALVPGAYLLAITSLFFLLRLDRLMWFSAIFSLIASAPIITVNLILIYFHLKDKDNLPINYFSSNQYLRAHDELTQMEERTRII